MIAFPASWRDHSRAVEIACSLTRLYGETALGRASQRHHKAVAEGKIGRADLYRAVCTVIEDRNGVITRWRENHAL